LVTKTIQGKRRLHIRNRRTPVLNEGSEDNRGEIRECGGLVLHSKIFVAKEEYDKGGGGGLEKAATPDGNELSC